MTNNSAESSMSEDSQPRTFPETNLILIFGVTLMAIMGVSSITPVFPMIMSEFHISKQEVGLLISFFTVPGVVFTPILGVLADRWGRKKVLVPSLMLFGLAGGACAFARDFNVLLILRCFQGLGAASLGTLNVAILGDLYTGKRRTAVLGYNMSVLSVGTASYPAVGGLLALFGIQYPFLLPLTAIPLGLLILAFLKNPEPRNDQKIGMYMKNALSTLKSKQALGLFVVGMMSFVILYGAYFTYLPILIGGTFGVSPFIIGLIISASSATTVITSAKVGFLIRRYPEKKIILAGFALYALALKIIPFVSILVWFILPTLIFGIGTGMNVPCIQSLLTTQAPIKYRATFLSIYSTALRVGQTLGPIIMGMVSVVWGIEGVFFAGTVLSLLMVFITFVMIK